MQNILDRIQQSYQDLMPFVAYRKPNADEVFGFFMRTDELIYSDMLSEEGFVFAPFDANEKTIFFPRHESDFIKTAVDQLSILNDSIQISGEALSSKKKHIELVSRAIDHIKKGKADKIVISRKESFHVGEYKLYMLFSKLLNTYPNAFVYVWFHPKVGLWLGATPETLLAVTDKNYETMSLAGTKKANDSNSQWTYKEFEEQSMVTRYIQERLKNVSASVQIHELETIKAGTLHHLKTKITGELAQKDELRQVVLALHPTPAICGLPKEEAKDFILKNEDYHRSFYTGFLGECRLRNTKTGTTKSTFYVNLRCLSIEDAMVSIYVGGGITKNSNAESEWDETVSKSETMKRIFQ